jgi:von Willebrand factor type A C-terminal domain/von Willebrand factor type A domain
MSAPDFSVEIFHNEFLPAGAREVNAIVTVTSEAAVAAAQPAATSAAEVIIVDCSGSMANPITKLIQAREATAAAIDAIRDGVAFAVIAGNQDATPFFPANRSLTIASTATRDAAKRELRRLKANGGTAIGEWLQLARRIFETRDDALRHAILLTDGRNEHQSAKDLDAAIAWCEGVFRCDCRGVGTDWKVEELRKVSSALLGTVDIVPDPAGLAADFAAMMQASMAKQVADVALQVWTPQHATIRFVKQVAPTVEDLTARRTERTQQKGDYPTGAWAPGESRDYHVCVDVQPGGLGQLMLAARVSLVYSTPDGPEILGQGQIKATWTDDEALSTKISQRVAHYTGQAELAQAIQDGLEARKRGDVAAAESELSRAVALAHESENTDTADLLAKIVDVDPATGVVRLKAKVSDADEMKLDTQSTKTVRVKK